MNAIAIALTRRAAGQVAVPDAITAVGQIVSFSLRTMVIKQAQFHTLC
jgi:hypothetical protein